MQPTLLFVLLTAAGTTGYTIIDSMGMKLIKPHFSSISAALLYLSIEYISCFLFLLPYVLFSRREKHELRLIRKYSLRFPVMTGLIIPCSYILILLAMQFASNVSFVVTFSQSSIFIGVLLGIFVLKEKRHASKSPGSCSFSLVYCWLRWDNFKWIRRLSGVLVKLSSAAKSHI